MKFESFDIYCEMLYRNNRAHKKNFNQRFFEKETLKFISRGIFYNNN